MEPAVAITEKSKQGEKKYLIKVFTKIIDQDFRIYYKAKTRSCTKVT